MKKNYKGLLVIIALVLVVLIALAMADEPVEGNDTVYMSNSVTVERNAPGADSVPVDEKDETAEDTASAEAEYAEEENAAPVTDVPVEEPLDETADSEPADEEAGEELSVTVVPDTESVDEPFAVSEVTDEATAGKTEVIEAEDAKAEETPLAEGVNERPFEYLRDEDGVLVLDEKGMPIPLAEEGYAIVASYETDEDGNLIFDEDGYPVVLDYEVRYINLDVRIELIILNDDGILTYGSNVRLQAVVENAPEGVELNYEWYNSADWEHPLPVYGDSYDFIVDHDNAMYSWRVDVWF